MRQHFPIKPEMWRPNLLDERIDLYQSVDWTFGRRVEAFRGELPANIGFQAPGLRGIGQPSVRVEGYGWASRRGRFPRTPLHLEGGEGVKLQPGFFHLRRKAITESALEHPV